MNKVLIFILAFLGFALISLFCIRLLSGEDDWICVDGAWVKHGQPTQPMPQTDCGISKSE